MHAVLDTSRPVGNISGPGSLAMLGFDYISMDDGESGSHTGSGVPPPSFARALSPFTVVLRLFLGLAPRVGPDTRCGIDAVGRGDFRVVRGYPQRLKDPHTVTIWGVFFF